MMLKSLLLAVVVALAFCSQQASAQNLSGSTGDGGPNSPQMSFTKNGNTLSITLTCQTTGYVMFVYGPGRCTRVLADSDAFESGKELVKADPQCTEFGGSHSGPEALVCDSNGCKGTNPGTSDSNFATVNNGFQCTSANNGGTISGTCTRTLGANERQFVKGTMKGSLACGASNSGSGHGTKSNANHIMVGPADAEPANPNPPKEVELGPQGSCVTFEKELAKGGEYCEKPAANADKPCTREVCTKYECCFQGKYITGAIVNDDINNTVTPGNPTTQLPGSSTLTDACNVFLQQLRSDGLVCPLNNYVALANQCQVVGSCYRADKCCQGTMVAGAGSMASPAAAVVLASALAMLALLF